MLQVARVESRVYNREGGRLSYSSIVAVRQGYDLYNHIHACGKPCEGASVHTTLH